MTCLCSKEGDFEWIPDTGLENSMQEFRVLNPMITKINFCKKKSPKRVVVVDIEAHSYISRLQVTMKPGNNWPVALE